MKTRELIEESSNTIVGAKTTTVDLARDVLKYVPVYWAAELVRAFSRFEAND